MEAGRLAILCSHLRPVDSSLAQGRTPTRFSGVSCSDCASGSDVTLDSEKEGQQKDCVFCKIIRGELPALKLFEDDACLCILDTNPLTHGHSLIIPKSHFSSLEVTPPYVVAAMSSKVPFISSAIMRAAGCGREFWGAFSVMGSGGYGGLYCRCLEERLEWKIAWVSRRCNVMAHLLAKWAARFSIVGFVPLSVIPEHIRVCDMHR